MPQFLVELYVARSASESVAPTVARARAAAEAVTVEGRPVRCVTSIFVPEDETCFLLVEAETADAVQATGRRAGLTFDRVVRVLPEQTVKH